MAAIWDNSRILLVFYRKSAIIRQDGKSVAVRLPDNCRQYIPAHQRTVGKEIFHDCTMWNRNEYPFEDLSGYIPIHDIP